MTLKIKTRIAVSNTLAAGVSTAMVFCLIYFVVHLTAYRHLDADILKEKDEILNNLEVKNDQILPKNSSEWVEDEHNRIEVNPTFVQISDAAGQIIYHSENIKSEKLKVGNHLYDATFFSDFLAGKQIRQGNFQVKSRAGNLIGRLQIGVSETEAVLVLQNLQWTLVIAYPFLLLVVFGTSYLAAAKGISPVSELVQTVQKIDENHMSLRLSPATEKDEIGQLSITINELLNRLEHSFQREKRTTADISHELRTPLTGIQGTIEVLLRKPRQPEQYTEKLLQILKETERMSNTIDHLLQLARIEAGVVQPNLAPLNLAQFISDWSANRQPDAMAKQIEVQWVLDADSVVITDSGMLTMIVDNLFNNVLKYVPAGSKLTIRWNKNTRALCFEDNGPGISAEKLPFIFDRFYRADPARSATIPGAGLGLSISQKLAALLHASLRVESEEGIGARFCLIFS
ncbi:MAG: HAMP domain-containing histidine kinase [Saprospiraceae bacterium]|nr:HAMP domain-containing histidine kinase [Saprospiraceae bacterium]